MYQKCLLHLLCEEFLSKFLTIFLKCQKLLEIPSVFPSFFDLVLLLGGVYFGNSLVVDMFAAMLTRLQGQLVCLISQKFDQEHTRSEHLLSNGSVLPMISYWLLSSSGKLDLSFLS